MGVLGTGELVVLLVVTLIVFGPQRLPELARYFAKFSKMFREASRELQNQLDLDRWDAEPPKKKKAPTYPAKKQENPHTYPYDPAKVAEGGAGGGDEYKEDRAYASGSNGSKPAAGGNAEKTAPLEAMDLKDSNKTGDAERRGREMIC